MPRNEFMGHEPDDEVEVIKEAKLESISLDPRGLGTIVSVEEVPADDDQDYSWGPGDVDWQLREQLKRKAEAGSITAEHQLRDLSGGAGKG